VIIGSMKPSRSRLVLFIARWAIMSGLAGIVFAVLVFTDRDRAVTLDEGARRLLFASASLLSIAFILAPFVRRAFVPVIAENPTRARAQTLLDEMRSGETSDSSPRVQAEVTYRQPATLTARLLVGLYIVFAAVLAGVLWTL
jgi:hypothetical protein